MNTYRELKPGEWGDLVGATIYTLDPHSGPYYSKVTRAVPEGEDNYRVDTMQLTPGKDAPCLYGHTFSTKPSAYWLHHLLISKDGNPGIKARRAQRVFNTTNKKENNQP